MAPAAGPDPASQLKATRRRYASEAAPADHPGDHLRNVYASPTRREEPEGRHAING